MSSWDVGIGGGPPVGGTYNYKTGIEVSLSEEIHHNNSNPPPFRGNVLPMPIPSHLPQLLLDSPNFRQQHQHQQLPPHGLYGHVPVPPIQTTVGHTGPQHHHLHGPGPIPGVLPPHLQQQHPPHYPHSIIDQGIHSQQLSHQGLHHHPNIPSDNYHVGLKLPSNSPLVPPIQIGIPVPHTPQGAPVSHPFATIPSGADKGPELPPHLTEQGWTKCWSKREGRYYFFNCNTNESIWELPITGRPHHGHHYDPMTDPLGIQHGGIHASLKRRASSGEHVGSPPAKRPIVSGPWDLEVSSNVYTREPETPRYDLYPPHPSIEQLRYQLLLKLRKCYQQACKSREQIDVPKESLNRWLMEQKINDSKVDPVFPCCENPEGVISGSMFKEIMNDVPMKLLKPRFTGDARKQLAKFAEACKKTIETRSASDADRKMVKWKADETFTWLRETVGAPYEAFQERLTHLKETVQPLVHEAAKSSVEGICKKISVLSRQYARQSRDSHLSLFVDPQNVKKDYIGESGRYKSQAAICGEYQFKEDALPQPQKPLVDYLQQDKDTVLIKHKSEPVRISLNYLHKLDALYKYHVTDDKKGELFLTRVYCLVKRYNAFCNEYTLCQSTQGSIPTSVFESIQRNFGVSFECFSSPFNCYFRNYCSAFADIDGFFGSSGTFFEYRPISGSFELNPPLCDDLIDAAVTHAECLLAGTQEPLSFIMFVPEFDGGKEKDEISKYDCLWIKRLQNSVWKRKQVTIPAFEHEYRSAAQHILPKSEIPLRSHHATAIFWLQNEAGFEEWKPTEEKVDSLIDAYRPGRERERDRQDLLSPERQNPHQADKAVAAAKAVSVGNSAIQPPSAMPTNA